VIDAILLLVVPNFLLKKNIFIEIHGIKLSICPIFSELMKKIVFSILISLLPATSFSANNVFIKGNVHFTSANVTVYFDSKKKQTLNKIDQVIFQKPAKKNLNFGFYSGRFWVKFTLDTLLESTQILELKNPVIDDICLYKREGTKWVFQGRVGDIIKFSERSIKHRFPQFLIKSKGEYLLRIENNGDHLSLKMNLFSPSQIKKRDYKWQVIAGMYFGILGIVLLFNLFMFILLKGKNNLILIIFLLAMLLFELSLTGYGYEWLWGNSPYLQNRILPWTAAISLLLIIRFMMGYLKIKKESPRIYLILIVSSLIILTNLGLSFINNGPLNVYIYSSTNIIILTLVVTFTSIVTDAARNRIKSSRLVLISFLGLFIGVSISALYYFGAITSFIIDNINIQFGVLFQAVFLTFAVLDGYKIFKDKANENLEEISRLKEEQISKLEAQVTFRTSEIIGQKEELERVNREIISSINYANRIQVALIPKEKVFLQNFKNGFLSFRPKEIVSGDFYWSCKIKDSNKNGQVVEKTLVIVGDTNTHGVPGALLSVLALRVIQALIFKKSVTSPGKLLDEVNMEFNKLFPKLEENKENVKGIYCTVCVIDQIENSVQFAGAAGRLFIRKNSIVTEYSGDNKFLGKGESNTNFQTNNIQLAQNDIIYMGTDGYRKQLKFNDEIIDSDLIDIFREYANLSIEEQKIIYLSKYEEMVKLNGQLDDFCIIGIQF